MSETKTTDAATVVPGTTHTDHNLTVEHMAFVLAWLELSAPKGFIVAEIILPDTLPALYCALHGPKMGDPPVPESECMRFVRGDRTGKSRMCLRPSRLTRIVTVVAGPHDGNPCVLFTAYGGPTAPREPFDNSIATAKEQRESVDFWHDHALGILF